MHTEEYLFEIAKEVYKINKHNLDGLLLTGSLMLFARGFNKRRDAADIDFICSAMCENGSGSPIAPKGFKLNEMDGSRSCVDSVQFINDEGIKIEFMMSDERECDVVDGVPCAGFYGMISAKLLYSKNDNAAESRNKHIDDILYLFENNFIA